MKIKDLIWKDTVEDKILQKHHVRSHEVEEVFRDKPRFWFTEKGRSSFGEDLYHVKGTSDARRYLIVFFIWKRDSKSLIVSARDMTAAERNRYEKK